MGTKYQIRNVGRILPGLAAALWLTACGGGGGGTASGGGTAGVGSSVSGTGATTIGADGGKVSAEGIATVVVPPGALGVDTTIRVAKDSTGAPAIPALFTTAGPMVAITPHGATFPEPVKVRLPKPNITLSAGERLLIAKAQPGGEWTVLTDTREVDGQLEVSVQSFSIFVPVKIRVAQALVPPFAFGQLTLQCSGQPCAPRERLRPMEIRATTSGNGGSLPVGCTNPQVTFVRRLQFGTASSGTTVVGSNLPIDVVGAFERSLSMPVAEFLNFGVPSAGFTGVNPSYVIAIAAGLDCTDATTGAHSVLIATDFAQIAMDPFATGPNPTAPVVVQFPPALRGLVGSSLKITFVLTGGASIMVSGGFLAPSDNAYGVVHIERRRAGESLWTDLGTVRQQDMVSSPYGGPAWMYWGKIITPTNVDGALELIPVVGQGDDGSSFRLRACVVGNGVQLDCSIGPVATLTVVQTAVLPSITQQPQSVVVQPGQTANLSAIVVGSPSPTLQWQQRTLGTTTWTNVAGNGTAASYTTPVLTLADDGIQYRLQANNAAGTVTSEVATILVRANLIAPTISTQPQSITVAAGSEALFAVNATGTEALSYQWLKGGVAISGANSPQLKIANATATDSGNYSVQVSNAAGLVTSTSATLTVTAGPPAAVAPTIVTQPAAVAVTEGNVATFAVGVTGSATLSFQWRRNGVDIRGATAAAFTLPAVTTADAGNYSVRVSNSVGTVLSQPATLAVSSAGSATAPVAPTIINQPSGLVVTTGMAATLAVGVQGTSPFAFQWLHDGQVMSGQTRAVLTLPFVTPSDAGSYRVQISNAAGSVTSDPAQILLLGAPAITTPPSNTAIMEGATATFRVVATGDGVRYQWLRNGVALDGAVADSYSTGPVSLSDNGSVYSVIVYNGAGLLVSPGATLAVTGSTVAYEGFAYPLNENLAGKNGSYGWSGAWEVADENGTPLAQGSSGTIVAGLGYTDANGRQLVASGGAWLTDAGISSGLARRLTGTSFGTPGTSRWVSFLVKQASITASPNISAVALGVDARLGLTGPFMAGISDDLSPFVGCLFCRSSNGAIPGLGAGGVTLVLVRTDFGTSGDFDVMSLWINPPLDSAVSLGAPTLTGFNARFGDVLTGVSLLWGYNRAFTFDELRVGSTRAEVTPFN